MIQSQGRGMCGVLNLFLK